MLLAIVFDPAQVGCYDPMPNANNELVVGLNLERIKYVCYSMYTKLFHASYVYVTVWQQSTLSQYNN